MSKVEAARFAALPEREKEEVTLPSGRTITILESTGREEKILGRLREKGKIVETIGQYLTGVTENLDGEPGPVPPNKFDDMLVGDRYTVLLQARRLTHGPIVTQKSTCTDCQTENEYEINLDEILEGIKPYPHGNEREFSLDLGVGTIHYELPTGKSEAKLNKEKETDFNSKLRSVRIWEVTPQGKFPVSLETLKSRHITQLRKDLRAHECTIDTLVTLTCPNCGSSTKQDVIGVPDFLFPSLT